ncbi:T9SS type A sorting domain-containing protein [candidate division KSB1 bacterium]|nr:T9SS type A sorting domain-containing protein [candidate division KSB1 bacterium]
MKNKLFLTLLFCVALTGFLSAQSVIEVFPGNNIADAMLTAWPGDIIELKSGTHVLNQTLDVTVDLTIRGEEGATVICEVPGTTGDAIHVKANTHFKNIIFITDTTRAEDTSCIQNMYGSVAAGDEVMADKNNIFVDACQFIGFYEAIFLIDPEDNENVGYPLDSLYISNSLIYGGGFYKTLRGINVEYRQARYVNVQNCTFWNLGGESMKIYGNDQDLNDYLHLQVDHCTFFDAGTNPPTAGQNGLGIYVKYTDGDDAIKNCVFYVVSDFAIKASGGNYNDTYWDYNIADSCGWKADCSTCRAWHSNITSTGPNSLISDIKLTNPDAGDFRLLDGSPAIGTASDGTDRGSSITVWNPGTWSREPSTGVEQDQNKSVFEFALGQNYPNPFNPTTTIEYQIPSSSSVKLVVYNLIGQDIATIVNEVQQAGIHHVNWNGMDDSGKQASSGVYFYRLQAGDNVETAKMILIR